MERSLLGSSSTLITPFCGCEVRLFGTLAQWLEIVTTDKTFQIFSVLVQKHLLSLFFFCLFFKLSSLSTTLAYGLRATLGFTIS
jgi:hypothetical protein